jgi:hypothetical protein
MANQDFLKPKGLNPDQLFHERGERVRFVNPPGYEFTQRGKTPDIGYFDKAREKFLSTQEGGLSVKGRPI